MWALIAKFAPSEDFQRKFMQSLARHFEINRAYFDLLWEQMQANSWPWPDAYPEQEQGYGMNTRNFSLPQLQNLPIEEARIVADALAVHATSRQIDGAASKLAALAEAGLRATARPMPRTSSCSTSFR